jgi:phosphatidylglycerophosphatase A
MRELFLTFFYSGYSPIAPGTVGTIAGALIGLLFLKFVPLLSFFLITLFITVVAINEIDKEERISGIHDSQKIVIDEVAGVWLALIIAGDNWIEIVLSIILFRVYDIWKPSIIGRVDRDLKGGAGVMGDDILAGIFAALTSLVIYGAMVKLQIV